MDRTRGTNGRFSTEYRFSDKQILDLYVGKHLSVAKVCEILNIGGNAVYKRLKELGVMRKFGETRKLVGSTRESKNPNWRGGKYARANGYVMIRLEDGTYRPEHQIVMEKMLGRRLKKGEVIHHKDGDKKNNAPDNLQLFQSHAEHMRFHMTSDEARKRGRGGGSKARLS